MPSAKILSLLKRNRNGLAFAKIQQELGVERKNRAKLLARLKELEAAGVIRFAKGRFMLAPAAGLVRGRFVTARPGFGFVSRADGGEDIFIPARFAEGVIRGDEVEVLVKEGRFGKTEGKIVRILKRAQSTILGVYRERGGAPFIQALESPSPEELPLRSSGGFGVEPGMIVEADRKTLAVSKVYGRLEEPGVDTAVVIRRYGLAAAFSNEALREAKAVPAVLTPQDLEGRRDFRDWETVTIDGEKAQDFDDAVSIRRLDDGGFLLGVHIADVSHYVRPESALDREALERATSVYFPDLTLPMIPERLSNDLCSLRHAVPRLTVSALLEIDAQGRVVGSYFTPSVIQTVERMTYTSVFKILQGDRAEQRRYRRLIPSFFLMNELAGLLRARRLDDGGLDFDLVEPELIYEEGKLMAVAAAERNDAHQLIEEFMVAANVAVATYFAERDIPAIYRVHPAPGVEDLEKLCEILTRIGFAAPQASKMGPKDLVRLLEKAKGRPEEKFVSVQVLRAMRIASYSTENVGHYGLAKTDYTHFTSPIRRYPDLAVHRVLKAALAKQARGQASLEAVAAHSSERERNADDAEQSLLKGRIFRLLHDRLGDEFTGIVVDATRAGLLVELDDFFVEGLLPFAALGGDYEQRGPARSRRGRKRTRRFDLGDRVRVILVSCDPVLQRMSFIPAPGAAEETSR